MSDYQYSMSVDELLSRLRKAIENDLFHILMDRPINQQTMDELDYKYEDVEAEFKTLKKHHCQKGPEPDDKRDRGVFWMFYKTIQKRNVYMKVMESKFGGIYVGFSFHFETNKR